MKKYILLLITAALLFNACSENEDVGFEDYYDTYLIFKVFLESDKFILFEGDPAVNFSATAIDERESNIVNFDYDVVVNNQDTLEGKSFLPQENGRYIFHAVVNGVESERITVDYIDPSQITNLELQYQGYDQLTTESHSVSGDFILLTKFDGRPFNVEITRSNIPLVINDADQVQSKSGLRFSEPGSYNVQAVFGNVTSNSINLTVRPAKSYDEIEMPVVFHYVNKGINTTEVQKAINSYNDVFANSNISLNSDPELSQWDNPSWVNANMRFTLAPMTESNGLIQDGIKFIDTENPINSIADLERLARTNSFDPNKFLNIYVTDDLDMVMGTPPVIPDSGGKISGIASVETAQSNNPFVLVGSDPYNSFAMGQFWGLLSTSNCNTDFAEDTFDFFPDTNDPYNVNSCTGVGGFSDNARTEFDARICLARSAGSRIQFDCKPDNPNAPSFFFAKNIMDSDEADIVRDQASGETGLTRFRNTITYDQRDRMRAVIENSRYRPTPRNN